MQSVDQAFCESLYLFIQDCVHGVIISTLLYGCQQRPSLIFLQIQGPVVQSVVSLTSSLRVISLTVLADSRYNILIFFAEKM